MSPWPVLIGYLLDGLVGDPPHLPHPVRGIGWLIARGERILNRGSERVRLLAGAGLALAVVGLSAGVAWALAALAGSLHPLLGRAVTAAGIGVLLARRSLAEEAGLAVYRPLSQGDLEGARAAVSRVVGRDTGALSESEVARAAVETLAENASDGIVAPLLFALAGGLPAIAAYKAINTLDSMIGHLDDQYIWFGRFAARLDDAANWIPARITFLALVAAAALTGRSAGGAWRAARTDAGRHASPNAGWPEAAMAGALSIRLGGLNYYGGEPHQGPLFNPSGRPPGPDAIIAAITLVNLAAHLVLIAGAAVLLVI